MVKRSHQLTAHQKKQLGGSFGSLLKSMGSVLVPAIGNTVGAMLKGQGKRRRPRK